MSKIDSTRAGEVTCAPTNSGRNAAERDPQEAKDTLVQVLQRRASTDPRRRAFVFLRNDRSEEASLSYAELDRRARVIAGYLNTKGLPGQRVLLAYPPGLDFVAGYFGCLYAGCVAVPVAFPHRRGLPNFRDVALDAGARLALSTSPATAQFRRLTEGIDRCDPGPAIPWLATEELPDAWAREWTMPDVGPETLAMLQYTSGSTSRPKGVLITHGNLIGNTRDIRRAFAIGRETSVFWLPMHHDMGLVGGVLEVVLAGATSVLMAPATFVQDPAAWLAAIGTSRAAISGGPNFAYDLCVRRISSEARDALDLSSWNLAFVGGEPIRPDTLDRFADYFAPCGFDRSAFYPCYGLAEATLMVSGATRHHGATVRSFDRTALGRRRVVALPDDSAEAQRSVSCGAPIGEVRVRIVDPETGVEAAPDRVGAIWIAGPSVSQGYWRGLERPDPAPAGPERGREAPFLRTGDLGFLFEGELHVIGRTDDVLIVRGRNLHPQDLEGTASRSHALLRAGFGAAFAVDDPSPAADARIVLVQEVTRCGETEYGSALEAIRVAVLREHDVALHAIALVRSGMIRRTSSGKVQRHLCRSAYLAGTVTSLAETSASAPDLRRRPSTERRDPAPTDGSPSDVLATVCQHALGLCGTPLSGVTPDTVLAQLGVDSLRRVELAAALEKSFACRLPDAAFGADVTLAELERAVETSRHGDSPGGAGPRPVPIEHYDFPRFPEYEELKRYERSLRAVAGDNPYFRVDEGNHASGSTCRIGQRDVITFSSYDYLGMARDGAVVAAAKGAIDRYGTGAGASRLVSGEKAVHRELEAALAEFLGTEAALAFVSGHATNVTTIGHLFGPDDLIVHDAFAHNSILQGARLSGATSRVFAHNDWRELDALLSAVRPRYRRVLIAIEGVYSMDGDIPELPRFVALRRKHKTLLLVDEAHSLGTMGATGRGLGEHWGTSPGDVDLWMGTLSKSLAGCGGFIAGSAALIEYLAYTAPGFVYSVGLSPPAAATALAALGVLRTEPQRVQRLRASSALFLETAKARGLDTGSSSGTPVIPLIVGSSVKCLRLARALFDRGISVQPILPPVVSEHAARLRFFVTVNHSEAQIRDAVAAVADGLSAIR